LRMETFTVCTLIVVGTGLVVWEIRGLPARIVEAMNEDDERFMLEQVDSVCWDEFDEDVDEAVGESAGLPAIIAVMKATSGEHPNITCGICSHEQCLTCSGRECMKCGMAIVGDPE
jgi:hypothetical protein